MHHVRGEMGLDWQTFRQELLVEFLPRLLAHEDAPAPIIFKGSAGSAHHLEDLHDGIVDISVLPTLVILNTHDNDHITRDGQAPSGLLLRV